MIVVDTSVLATLLLESERSTSVDAVYRRDPLWAAPILWRSELRNVLATGMRAGRYDLTHALRVMETAEEILAGRELEVPSHRVLRLTQESGCTAYDCEFVALAQALEVPLVTLDRALLRAFPHKAVAPEGFAPESD